jgi:nucleoside-diphosphate-sugar epimerase
MDLKGKKVAVTGATGFLGQYIVDRLLKHNADVIAVVRNPDKVPALKTIGIEIRKADLTEKNQLIEAFRGCDAVVSNAAQIGARNFNEMVAANVGGTENVINAIHEAGVKRCIMVSSCGVYRYAKSSTLITEDYPLRTENDNVHFFSSYAISKAMAETRGRELCENYDIDLSIVRPMGIFGAFDYGTFSKWFKLIMNWPICPYPVGVDVCLVYAGDIAEAICLMLEKPVSIGKAYNICGPSMDAWHFYSYWKQAGGKVSKLRIPIPVPLKQIASNQLAKEDLGWQLTPMLDACKETIATENSGSHW